MNLEIQNVLEGESAGCIVCGDCLDVMQDMPDGCVQCCVTSPPYWGLRDYGVDGQIGLEKTPEEFVEKMVEIFREVKRVLRDDGTLWLNMGDSYAGGTRAFNSFRRDRKHVSVPRTGLPEGLKPKDLCGIPWRLAFALQADGWYLRQDIIWHKPNPMPESVRDRCTKSHEYIFLLSKSPKYFYDQDGIREESIAPAYSETKSGMRLADLKKLGLTRGTKNKSCSHPLGSNKRSVWTVSTQPCKEAHFATFPPALIEPCILAGAEDGSVVFDPFMGAGTTAKVAAGLGRKYIGSELNPEYIEIAKRRVHGPLFAIAYCLLTSA